MTAHDLRTNWRKSTYSGDKENCVEVAIGSDAVGVRDTKNRQAGHLAITPGAWRAFLECAAR
ncbi:DUF397 domain-containing protein [Amycolatopsis nigrescens]|uniref:DUF397 domain-containing protein n=1 Tax=Amycolatopsis nigrescens TaxID=381445 RepID=UPI0009FEC897|nr:DUF397 domain-containing protein [Amycolatopsis nigrescens]